MNFLRNISVKIRLTAILIVWIITFICVGIFAIVQMENISSVTKSIYTDPMQVSNAAIEARVDIIKIQRDMRALLILTNKDQVLKSLHNIAPLDERVMGSFDIINTHSETPETINLEKEARQIFQDWIKGREDAINLLLGGNLIKATDVVLGFNSRYVIKLENILVKIDANSRKMADILIKEADGVESTQKNALIILITSMTIVFIFFFILITNSILKPITMLTAAMDNSANTGNLSTVQLNGKNEIVDMTKYYNVLVCKLKDMFWVKDSQNVLSQELSGCKTLDELTQKAVNFISEIADAGKGVLYTYNSDNNMLYLKSSYAFTQQDKLHEKIAIGEGIIGQAALQKKPIFLNNINKKETYISTGIIDEAPLNTYTIPLIYEDQLYGVVSLASFEHFNKAKLEVLDCCSNIIAVNLYSSFQTQTIKDLLYISEKTQEEVRESAEELREANLLLQQQQELLQQQTEELQQTNTELEEQQQLLQQQSEELQQTNTQLEEQQQQLEEQARVLNIQNKQLEETGRELKKRSEELENSNRYKSEFLANMSHELRTPLNSIILLSKLLLNKAKSKLVEGDKEKIDIINNAGQELLRLINDILDLSKIEAGRMTVDVQEFDSGFLISETKRMFEGLTSEKGLNLVMEDMVNNRLCGDVHKISQILRNLISNAIKFTNYGYITLNIARDGVDSAGVVFTVKDTGIGIAPQQQAVIFEEFQQGDGSISRKYGGTGLGLSISKKLAELLGGKIKVRSELGHGSEFSLYIPNLIPDNPGIHTSSLAHYWAAEKETAAGSLDVRSQDKSDNAVLVIEDDLIFAEYLKDIIQGMGFNSIIAANGKDGLQLAKQHRPKGILLDLGLPDISGIDVLRELKSTIELREIPVHVISVWEKNFKPQRMGAVGFKQKPIEESQIVKLISQMIDFSEKDPKQLLLIEDNPVQQEAIKEIIGNGDIVIKAVDTQIAAQNEILKGSYDVIVLDLALKEGNGLNVCKFIGEKKIEIPLIVYTGRELSLEEEKEIRTYADSIIIKTANSEERLLDEVTLFLHKVKRYKKDEYYINSKTKEDYSLNLQGKTIMIVDDDPRNVYVLASALEQYGANVLEAGNGKDALEKLKDNKIDLVLMDIMMPEMDGYETIIAIRKTDLIKEIPIIAITAKSLKSDKDKCIEAGANDYISKPVDYDTLVRLVKVWSNKK
ncbi:MAG TPA: response regulator [Pseudobacteroides sp.]|uniref:response regulator n=1 Tax=Pseudobacteroides sp. TaxID=1968840 RepID=UPI002F9426FE